MTLQSTIRAAALVAVAISVAWAGPSRAQLAEPEEYPGAESESLSIAPEEKTDEEKLDELFARLADPDEPDWERVRDQIIGIWSRSGSDSMDLLLRRGRDAMNEGELVKAIHHLSALVEHAPDFAEGWNARATAFYMRGEYGQSLADIEQVLRLEPRHFSALGGLGLILDQLDRNEAALIAFRESLRLNPHEDRIRQQAERLEPLVDGQGI